MDWPHAGASQQSPHSPGGPATDCLCGMAFFLPVSAYFRLGSRIVQSILQSPARCPLSDRCQRGKPIRTKLTDRFVKSEGGRSQVSDFMDDEIIGFGIQVGATGPKSFTLDYTFDGRRRRLFI